MLFAGAWPLLKSALVMAAHHDRGRQRYADPAGVRSDKYCRFVGRAKRNRGDERNQARNR